MARFSRLLGTENLKPCALALFPGQVLRSSNAESESKFMKYLIT
jgi:hypothetical protein